MRCRLGFSVLGLTCALLQTAGCGKPSASPGSSAAEAKPADSTEAKSPGPLTAQAVLEKMVAAYHSARTYEDFATAELWEEGTSEPRRADFKVAFQRPDKLRMEFYQGRIVCDGKKWLAFCKDIPGQAALREAPKKLTLPMLQADTVVNQAVNKGFAGASPQLLLLLEDKPLTILLDGVQGLSLGEPARIGEYDCYLVRFRRSDGEGEYWIDQKSFVLRRMRFRPTGRTGERWRAGQGRRQHGGEFRAGPVGRRHR